MVDRLRAIGFPLLAALGVLAASVWAFGLLAENVIEDETGSDQRLADWLHGQATDPFTDLFRSITFLGNFATLLVVTLVAVAVLWRRRERTAALFVALAFVGGQVLSNGMKLGFRRERPFFPDPLATASTFSFPSGHALVSLTVYGALAVVLARHLSSTRYRALLFAGTAVLVLVIGFSRLYLGVHFLSDVLAGFAAGLAWLSLLFVVLLFREARTGRQYEGWPQTKSPR